MPRLSIDRMRDLAQGLLRAAGAPDAVASLVAEILVDSDRKGVESHGVAQLPWYLDEIRAGNVDPAAEPHIEAERPGCLLIDGARGFGIYAFARATRMAIEKARRQGACAAGVKNCGHTGRMGAYAEMAAEAGMFGLAMGGGAHRRWANVVPFGGAAPVMSTNPYALAMPGGPFGSVVADFATSMAADGKIAMLRARGQAVPEGWILDKHGRPTTDPEAFFDRGLHLPAAGHKGYGLGIVAELMGDAALGCPPDYNWFVMAVDLALFSSPASYGERAGTYLSRVKATPPAPGVSEVLLPGEPERHAAAARDDEGVEIPERVWNELADAAGKLGLDLAALVSRCPPVGEG